MREEEILGLFGGLLGCSFVIVCLAVVLVIWWKIFDKAGYGGPFGLLMIVPLVNLVMLFILAFAKWPVIRELEEIKSQLRRQEVTPNPPSYPMDT